MRVTDQKLTVQPSAGQHTSSIVLQRWLPLFFHTEQRWLVKVVLLSPLSIRLSVTLSECQCLEC